MADPVKGAAPFDSVSVRPLNAESQLRKRSSVSYINVASPIQSLATKT